MIGALFQANVLGHFSFMDVKVDLVLLLVVSWGMIRGTGEGILWGFLGGIVLDLLSAVPFGTTTLALVFIGFLSGMRGVSFTEVSLLFVVIAAPVATIIFELLQLAILSLFGWQEPIQDVATTVILPSALLNTAAMPFVYWLLSFVKGRLRLDTGW